MTDYAAHPAADIFPLMSEAAFAEFKEDIRQHGQSEPIALWCGQILDGRNRWRACKELGLIPLTRDVPQATDPVAYVVSANLHRRHLDTNQRAGVGAKIRVLFEEAARCREKAGKSADGKSGGRGKKKENPSANLREGFGSDHEKQKASEQAAEAVNVSPRSVEYASKVLDSGTPELFGMIESGEVSVSAAAAVATLPKEEQKKVVDAGPKAVKKKAKEVRKGPQPSPLPSPCPHSDRFRKLTTNLSCELHQIHQEPGGLKGLLADRKKWDERYVKETLIPIIRELVEDLMGCVTEIENAFEQTAR